MEGGRVQNTESAHDAGNGPWRRTLAGRDENAQVRYSAEPLQGDSGRYQDRFSHQHSSHLLQRSITSAKATALPYEA